MDFFINSIVESNKEDILFFKRIRTDLNDKISNFDKNIFYLRNNKEYLENNGEYDDVKIYLDNVHKRISKYICDSNYYFQKIKTLNEIITYMENNIKKRFYIANKPDKTLDNLEDILKDMRTSRDN